MTCTASGTAVAGQYGNIGTASGYDAAGDRTVTDADASHYFGVAPTSHFQAFDVDKGKSTRLPAKPVADLEDQFGSTDDVTAEDRPEYLFAPTDKNAEGTVNADDHLACYKIKGFKAELKVLIENQFGTQTLKVKKGELLCAPTAMASTPPIPDPSVAPLVENFQCYGVDKGQSTRLANKPVVQLDDEFGFIAGVEVEDRPELLCNPVGVDGLGILNTEDHLACYHIKGFKAHRDVWIANDFGGQMLRLKDGKLLCVPSTKTEL